MGRMTTTDLVHRWLALKSACTPAQVAEDLRVPYAAATSALARLVREGSAERIAPGRYAYASQRPSERRPAPWSGASESIRQVLRAAARPMRSGEIAKVLERSDIARVSGLLRQMSLHGSGVARIAPGLYQSTDADIVSAPTPPAPGMAQGTGVAS